MQDLLHCLPFLSAYCLSNFCFGQALHPGSSPSILEEALLLHYASPVLLLSPLSCASWKYCPCAHKLWLGLPAPVLSLWTGMGCLLQFVKFLLVLFSFFTTLMAVLFDQGWAGERSWVVNLEGTLYKTTVIIIVLISFRLMKSWCFATCYVDTPQLFTCCLSMRHTIQSKNIRTVIHKYDSS